ncbi:MAG: hypothetical protein ACE5HU_10535, partial [Acidobacteriota bacterium]
MKLSPGALVAGAVALGILAAGVLVWQANAEYKGFTRSRVVVIIKPGESGRGTARTLQTSGVIPSA